MNDKQSKTRLTAYFTDSTKRLICALLLAFGTVCALPRALKFSEGGLGFSNSVWSVLLFGGLSCLFFKVLEHEFQRPLKKWFLPGVFGFLFAFCMIAGSSLDVAESVPFTEPGLWFAVIMLGIASGLVLRYWWDRIYGLRTEQGSSNEGAFKESERISLKSWLIRSIIIFVCYLPVFLAVYPGFFVYDAQDEYMQVVTRNFTTHHPLVHVLLLGGIIHLFYKLTGAYNVGIACYTLFQMLVMSGIFGWCIEQLKERGLKKTGQVLLTAYFGFCPVLVMFSLCSAKDGLFTGMLLVMVVLLREICLEPESFLKKKGKVFLFLLASLGMMLLRHNGFYAFLVFIPLVTLVLRKYWKPVLFYLLLIVVLYLGIDKGVAVLLKADASENQEMLTVPIMQMARVYTTDKDISADEKVQLENYLPKEALERYVPKVSDGVKVAFDNEAYATDKAGFWKLWLKWGAENPFTYMNAWFMTSYGFWYPDTVIDVYRGNTVFTYTYEDSSYFGYEVEAPGHRESKIPWLDELYRKMSLEIFQQKVPVISMLFSPGFMFWAMMFLLGFFLYVGEIRRIMPFMLPLLVWLTVILGPTYLVRYVLFLWFAVPLLLWEVVSFLRENPKTN